MGCPPKSHQDFQRLLGLLHQQVGEQVSFPRRDGTPLALTDFRQRWIQPLSEDLIPVIVNCLGRPGYSFNVHNIQTVTG